MSRGGRSRGGASRSFTREQMTALLGTTSNESQPALVTQPPPLYPLMDRRPVPLQSDLETDYLLILKQDFIDRMQLSASYLKPPQESNQINKPEIDILVAQLPKTKVNYDWNYFPAELRPKMIVKKTVKKSDAKNVDIQSKLNQLEKLEETGSVIKKEVSEDEESEKKPKLTEEEEDTEIFDEDEEMDDDTDYTNSYFDNGEAYEDEDDNLDDGPIF